MTTAPRKVKNEVDYPVWLSTEQAARYLGVSDRTLHVVAVPGGLPCYRFGRVFRFRLEDLKAYIDGTRVVSGRKETTE